MIDLAVEGPVATIRLNRPERRNAIGVSDWRLLADRLAEAAGQGARVVMLTGAGSAFSAGADLDQLARLAEDSSARGTFRESMRVGIEAIAASPVPVVAAINGDCHGAAVALAMACDVRAGAPAARFSIPPARFGIGYPQADIDRLVALVGLGQAARLLLAAETIDAAEACRIGLVDLVGEDRGRAIAAAIGANDADSVALLRRQIGGMDRARADEAFDACFGSAAFRELAARRLKAVLT